ncbi:MAG: GatB/YqeY domain-containing protein [Deltaproteobacteria bacterium]|nr:GatB/YqeY domain-containing protein [Deltaproteobacteria bacterium]
MSALVDRVSDELKKAMLAKDAGRTTALRMIRAAFIELAKEGKGEVTDDRCLDALRRLKKQREESIQSYEQAGRAELAAAERAELAVVDGFLPQLADEATTLGWVREAIAASGATNAREFGKVMGVLMKTHKSDIDATLARTLITRELGG